MLSKEELEAVKVCQYEYEETCEGCLVINKSCIKDTAVTALELMEENERLNSVNKKMDECMCRNGKEIMQREEQRADMQFEIDRLTQEKDAISSNFKFENEGLKDLIKSLESDIYNLNCNLEHMTSEFERWQQEKAELVNALNTILKLLEDNRDKVNFLSAREYNKMKRVVQKVKGE